MTTLEQSRGELVAAMVRYRDNLRRELAAPHTVEAPTPRIGRLPTRVQVKAIEDTAERRQFIDELLAKGYHRARVMQRLEPGLFDVNHRDGAVTVRWWPMAEQEAA